MNKIYLSVFLPYLILTGCATRAPSDYELDRRAGLVPSVDVEKKIAATDLRSLPKNSKDPKHPMRRAPRLEKVWVYDQELEGGFWMQGTFVYLEVAPGEWLLEPGMSTEVTP
jgi:hypothetical protein